MSRLDVTKIAVGPYDNNAYILRCRATGEALLVDAAAEPERLLSELASSAAAAAAPRPSNPAGKLSFIVTTHRHPDHWQALTAVAEATGARIAAHPADADALPVPVPVHLADGDMVSVGEVSLRVLRVPGHTPGSICLLYEPPDGSEEPQLFTGDSLFPGGPGKTDGDMQRFTTLMDGLERQVFAALPDSTWVYPGHGADTTIGAERPSVPAWRARGW
ncbi:MAG: MBL fold metallo-hydrolase [Acidimicrobiales bacterium]